MGTGCCIRQNEVAHLGVVFGQGRVAPGAAQRRLALLEELESGSQGHASQAMPCLQERGSRAFKGTPGIGESAGRG